MPKAATRELLAEHRAPEWFRDAKLGIFVHWGLYSVPAWAPLVGDIQSIIRRGGLAALMSANPYAEWYQNSLRIKGTPTARYHAERWGAGRPYESFQADFERSSAAQDPNAWANLFAASGARYVVMVTKHHDGYLLWPSANANPRVPDYRSRRDLVGELAAAVRGRGMRMGLYYSGVLDWTFQRRPIVDLATFITQQRQTAEYARYATAHWRELVERYRPAVLWNDIGYPAQTDVPRLMADYYAAIPDGAVNDRWNQVNLPPGPLGGLAARAVAAAIERKTRSGHFEMPPTCHYDFRTPEYATYDAIRPECWESCRGVGNSFGLNDQETEEQMLRPEALIGMLVDIASKNGNLLLNVGPAADGTIPEMQRTPLLALGRWLERNGEAIHGTRPWVRPADTTDGGLAVRYTTRPGTLFATLLHTPAGLEDVALPLHPAEPTAVRMLGLPKGMPLRVRAEPGRLEVALPSGLPASPGIVLAVEPPPAR